MYKVFRGYKEFMEKGWTNNLPDYEGIVFTDGTVSVRWLTRERNITTWNNYEDFHSCYGNGYEIQWMRDETYHSSHKQY